MIDNNQYTKTLQEAVDIKRKVIFKSEKNNYKSNTQKENKIEVVSEINQMVRILKKHRNIQNDISVVQERMC